MRLSTIDIILALGGKAWRAARDRDLAIRQRDVARHLAELARTDLRNAQRNRDKANESLEKAMRERDQYRKQWDERAKVAKQRELALIQLGKECDAALVQRDKLAKRLNDVVADRTVAWRELGQETERVSLRDSRISQLERSRGHLERRLKEEKSKAADEIARLGKLIERGAYTVGELRRMLHEESARAVELARDLKAAKDVIRDQRWGGNGEGNTVR